MNFDQIVEDFEFLDDWEDRYRAIIELGNGLVPLGDEFHTEDFKVKGCTSQVWLVSETETIDGKTVLKFRGDSDAHIVRGLVAVLIALYSGKTADEILAIDAHAALAGIDLENQLTPQRSNGLFSMVERIRRDAAKHA